MRKTCFLFVLILFAAACGKERSQTVQTAGAGDPNRGRAIYLSNCAACHNEDPSRDGSIGPAIKCSSMELIKARVLKTDYPEGYTPKRKTKAMPAQPYLESSIPDLAAFLRCSTS